MSIYTYKNKFINSNLISIQIVLLTASLSLLSASYWGLSG
jgi:hypothetical protein